MAQQTYKPYKFASDANHSFSEKEVSPVTASSPQGDPKAPTESPPVRHLLRRSAPLAEKAESPLPRQRKMFPKQHPIGSSIKCIASPETGDPASKSFRTANRNVSIGLVPALDFSAVREQEPTAATEDTLHSNVPSARNRESVEFKAAICGESELAVSASKGSVSQRTPGRVLPEKVWQPVKQSSLTARPQSGSLGPDCVPLGGTSEAPPAAAAARQATLIVPGLAGGDEPSPQPQHTYTHRGSGRCPWAPSAEPVRAPAAPPASVACAAAPLSRTFATYTDGPRQINTARYGRHLAKQEAQEHHVRLSAGEEGLRTAQWSRRYVAPGNPLFANLRFPLDASLVKAPTTEYAKSFSSRAPAKGRA